MADDTVPSVSQQSGCPPAPVFAFPMLAAVCAEQTRVCYCGQIIPALLACCGQKSCREKARAAWHRIVRDERKALFAHLGICLRCGGKVKQTKGPDGTLYRYAHCPAHHRRKASQEKKSVLRRREYRRIARDAELLAQAKREAYVKMRQDVNRQRIEAGLEPVRAPAPTMPKDTPIGYDEG